VVVAVGHGHAQCRVEGGGQLRPEGESRRGDRDRREHLVAVDVEQEADDQLRDNGLGWIRAARAIERNQSGHVEGDRIVRGEDVVDDSLDGFAGGRPGGRLQ
jgi:hypothetical protein